MTGQKQKLSPSGISLWPSEASHCVAFYLLLQGECWLFYIIGKGTKNNWNGQIVLPFFSIFFVEIIFSSLRHFAILPIAIILLVILSQNRNFSFSWPRSYCHMLTVPMDAGCPRRNGDEIPPDCQQLSCCYNSCNTALGSQCCCRRLCFEVSNDQQSCSFASCADHSKHSDRDTCYI